MGFGTSDISAAIARAKARMATLEQDLNAADSHLGDGDTGGMLARVIDRLSEENLNGTEDVGAAFSALARAAVSATGSSLGTLLATALMTMSKATRGRADVPWSELGDLLAGARDAMLARGGAKLGDKTVIDALDAVANATRGVEDGTALARAASVSAADVLARFRDEPCRMGRARMFGDKSRGMDDPGMLALVRLTDAIAGF
ncbi:dihydroxyacetone kinase subunit L [Microvirga sp. TS319]|uniref:dihydroxyacetone kinase subunit L n=1 Tax=Microvirga sp. TS319 TaxID=3241165 RepID=UPI00351A5B86